MALTDSLVSWYDLEEASGTRVDAHGSNDLTDNNGVGSRTGQIGTAADFVRSNGEYLSNANSGGNLNTHGGSWTWAFWYYLNQKPGGGDKHNIIDYQENISPSQNSLLIRFYVVGGVLELQVMDGDRNISTLYSGSDVPVSEWAFVTIRYDSSTGEIWARLNNKSPETWTVTAEWADSGGVRIGELLDGGIDSCGFWSRDITTSEVDELWNGGAGVSYSDISSTGTTYTNDVTVTQDDGTTAISGVSVTWELSDGTTLDSGTTDSSGQVSLSAEIADSDLPDTTDVTASDPDWVDQTKQKSVDTNSTSYTTSFALAAAEAVSVSITATPSITETTQAAESISVPITGAPALVESAAASEAASVAIATTPNITETAAVDEVVAVGATATPSVAETGEATESASVQSTATPSVTETASVSEAISVGVQATVSIVETVGTAVFESISVPITGSPSVTESTAASESVSAQATATPSLSESASASEALSAAVQASPNMTESASATEQIQVTAQAAVSLIETATVTEAIQIGVAATVSIMETVGEIAGRRLSEVGKNAVKLLTRSQNEAEKQ